ncbi:beta-N-acetylhexosaminidase [Halorussus amylolyticus]|uniref:beta-N-acetylhexosaminidase n=1 Tax=Halorussus amylolyticus TaxID=1126242 RepID=UPI00104368E1|nr:beta-N-acetylhexosaminidase [Halorussus amylolyticus]
MSNAFQHTGNGERNVAEWDLKAKVAQLFVVGFRGTTPDDAVREFAADGVGGVIYFARNVENPEQVADLSRSLQRTAAENDAPPLLVSIDEEGGIVSRLPWAGRLPGGMTVGATRDPDLAERAGAAKARELRAVGVNVDLAPVLDVNNNPDNPVIGVRSFGEDPELVSELGAATAEGFESENVVACGKHFPGHGDTDTDSHLDLPVIDHDRDRLDRVELAPFRAAIEADIGAIMTTHVAFPAFTDDAERPATLSKSVLTGLLREDLGYDGLIATDCMEMNAIADTVGTPEGAVQAVEAGCDLVMVSHTPETQRAAIDAVVEAVESGRIAERRIEESVRRILRTKREYDIGESSPDYDSWADANDESKRVARRIAEQGVTLVRDRDANLPVGDGEIRVVQFPGGAGSEVEESGADAGAFVERLRECVADREGETAVEVQTLDGESAAPSAADSLEIDPGADETVVVCTRNAAANSAQAEVVSQVSNSDANLVVVAIRNPYDLSAFPEVSTYLTTYDDAPISLAVAAEIVAGEREAQGRLPVTIPDE